METIIDNFSIIKAKSLKNLLRELSNNQKVRPFAGGTDIMVELAAGLIKTGEFIDINDISELRYTKDCDDYLEVGSLTTYKDFLQNSLIASNFPLLVRAAEETAAPAIQNRGTIGGNIINASPAADTPPCSAGL